MMSPRTEVIRIAAVVLSDPGGRVLGVRKTGTTSFMLPGGKVEPGEQPRATAVREVREELHLRLEGTDLEHLGRFSAPAANEANCRVDCDVFRWSETLSGDPAVFEEIEESRWFPVTSADEELAPLSRDVVFPLLRGR